LLKFVYATEVPPAKMKKVLTEEWKMGGNLASVMLDHFGGHVYVTWLAIQKLKERKNNFRSVHAFPVDRISQWN
jgi:hypothetical protein